MKQDPAFYAFSSESFRNREDHNADNSAQSDYKTGAFETAGFLVRSLAYIIDRVVLSLLGVLFFAVAMIALKTGSYIQGEFFSLGKFTTALMFTYLAMIFVKIAYYTYFHGRTGQTVGKMICGIKVVNIQKDIISYRRAFLRWIGYFISSFVLYLGFLWAAVDKNHQGWHDKIAGTYVIAIDVSPEDSAG